MTSITGTHALPLCNSAVLDLSSHTNNPATVESNPEPKISTPPSCEGAPLFEPGDGDVQITVNGTRFETHKYLIKRFRGLKQLLDTHPLEINIQHEKISAEDFNEMFKMLYASITTEPFEFTSHTLISTLRITTVYEYQALRNYCIKRLGALDLDAVKQIELAHEFHIPGWEEPACYELAKRDTLITREEAKIIGLDAFMSIVEIREEHQRKQRETNVETRRQDGQPPPPIPSAEENSAQPDVADDGSHEGIQQANDAVTRLDDGGTETGPLFTDLELNGLCGRKTQHGYAVEVPGCKCRFSNKDGLEEPGRSCLISSCAISALKNIQIRQLAHASSISALESSVGTLAVDVDQIWRRV